MTPVMNVSVDPVSASATLPGHLLTKTKSPQTRKNNNQQQLEQQLAPPIPLTATSRPIGADPPMDSGEDVIS